MKKIWLLLCLLLIPLQVEATRTWPTQSLIGGQTEYTLYIKDDFLAGTTTSGSVGELGWTWAGSGGTPALTNSNTTRPGVVRLTAGSSSTNTNTMTAKNAAATEGLMAGSYDYELTAIVYLPSRGGTSAAETMQVGLTSASGAELTVFECSDTTNWYTVTVSGGNNVKTSSVACSATTWYKFTIIKTGSSVAFYINGNLATAAHTTNIPTGQLQPYIFVQTGTSGQRSIDIDYFSLKIPSITR